MIRSLLCAGGKVSPFSAQETSSLRVLSGTSELAPMAHVRQFACAHALVKHPHALTIQARPDKVEIRPTEDESTLERTESSTCGIPAAVDGVSAHVRRFRQGHVHLNSIRTVCCKEKFLELSVLHGERFLQSFLRAIHAEKATNAWFHQGRQKHNNLKSGYDQRQPRLLSTSTTCTYTCQPDVCACKSCSRDRCEPESL